MTELSTDVRSAIETRIAKAVGASVDQVRAAVDLLDEGATVPFIARYRKEVTGGLDDTQLRDLQEQLIYQRELEERRASILQALSDSGKLTEELERDIWAADTKQRLEDLYLPYKPKRRTRAQVAREAGLEPLAMMLWEDPMRDPETQAAAFVNPDKGVADVRAALDGARDILAEVFFENADMLEELREFLWKKAYLVSKVVPEKETDPAAAKYSDYFDYDEPIETVPSHRALAVFRGRQEGLLTVKVLLTEEEEALPVHPCQALIARAHGIKNLGRPADVWLAGVVRWCWRVKCLASVEGDLLTRLRERAETEAIGVFGTNLKDLLLAAPAGHKGVIGLDPGIRTGVKVAVISDTGAVLDTTVIYPHEPRRDWEGSIHTLAQLARKYGSKLISIGNGTASRETDKLAGDLISRHPELGLTKIVVSEAGASVYSASAAAAAELPDLDVSYRGAVSIARRLQDPLAELVKIDPKAIGVGQYQHDVNQSELVRKLDAVVEDCVNAVGVDVNTASAALLVRVAGLSSLQAKSIVSWREKNGAFAERRALLDVPRLGPKTFEQAAGFLRIPDAADPLDASGVHPEAYPVVQRIVEKTGLSVKSLIGNHDVLSRLKASDYTDEQFGVPTVTDILKELEKPGRDPRPEFKTAKFQEGVHEIKDLVPGMTLEGVVSNVAAFGAFVDIGVHQDGLVHVSELSDRFVRDPREVVKVGDIVRVRVLDVDVARKRISLSMRSREKAVRNVTPATDKRSNVTVRPNNRPQKSPSGAMAAAFAGLKLGR
ncbi:RNA-binding transcriptional accessory protein [Sutterella sp. AM11-39]|uniref:Tex family protein n=1 Tax=Sutterella sp. AM11-39 TaxID=2292075 RepID=UPI000E4BB846|nr:Tex family protein [Sutterella sp. AM11-39]RHJ32927.1 RNA-binding transcriptional accessory protein [Sutterella sp. AM11-39]